MAIQATNCYEIATGSGRYVFQCPYTGPVPWDGTHYHGSWTLSARLTPCCQNQDSTNQVSLTLAGGLLAGQSAPPSAMIDAVQAGLIYT
jgi:hypothetical protein